MTGVHTFFRSLLRLRLDAPLRLTSTKVYDDAGSPVVSPVASRR